MLLECSNCGAPLDGRDSGLLIKCNYCGRTHRTGGLKAQAQELPTNWKPPTVWSPPVGYASAAPLTYQTGKAVGNAVLMTALAPILFAVIGGGVAVSNSVTSSSGSSVFGGGWDGKQQLSCSGVDKVSASGINSAKLDTAVHAQNACELELTNSTISAEHAVIAEHGSKVTIRGGTINAGREGFHISDGAQLALYNVHIRVGNGRSSMDGVTAFDVSGAGKVELHDCTVEILSDGVAGEAYAIKARDGTHVTVDGGKITGRYTIQARSLGDVEVTNADVAGTVDVESPAVVKGVKAKGGGGEKASGNGDKAPGFGDKASGCGCAAGDHACHRRCKQQHR